MVDWIEGKVIENRRWNDGLHSLRVEVELPPFRAGQFTRLALTIGSERIARPYSLVNAPHEPIAEFYFNRVPEGPLSNRIAALAPGDRVDIASPATGLFTLDEVTGGRHLWMLATGTGLGPFLSILKTEQPWTRFERLVLVHGAREASDLGYREQAQALAQAYPGRFHYVAALTRESPPWALYGRIPALIDSGLLEQAVELEIKPEDSQVMMCGNLGMIQDTTASLLARGLEKSQRRKPGQITTEKYW
ncbi:MAG: ferredoxin--NADP reductase [Thiotrichales bacterium]